MSHPTTPRTEDGDGPPRDDPRKPDSDQKAREHKEEQARDAYEQEKAAGGEPRGYDAEEERYDRHGREQYKGEEKTGRDR